jgi:hypothetical protein
MDLWHRTCGASFKSCDEEAIMYKKLSEIDLDWLKRNHQMIHYFGLGFIQLKINEKYRLHFYTDELPGIVDEEDIHNHRYGFKSTILLGSLTQNLFLVTPGSTHLKEQDNCRIGFKMNEKPIECGILFVQSKNYVAGTSYSIKHDEFHRVKTSKTCITLLERQPYQKELADIVRKKSADKVCPFSLKIPEAKLWDIVEKLLKKN